MFPKRERFNEEGEVEREEKGERVLGREVLEREEERERGKAKGVGSVGGRSRGSDNRTMSKKALL